MNALRNLFALLCLVCGTAVFAQTIQLTVGAAVGGPADAVARAVATELTLMLDKQVIIINRVGEAGALAVREFGAARADGSQLLFLSALIASPTPEVGSLVPIAMVAGETSSWKWAGFFAPPGTPASVVRALESAVMTALNSPRFRSLVMRLSNTKFAFSPTPGDGAQLARLVAQSAGGGTTSNSAIASTGANAQADDPKVVGGAYRR